MKGEPIYTWIARRDGDTRSPVQRYGENNTKFISVTLMHVGTFNRHGGIDYPDDPEKTFDNVDPGHLNVHLLQNICRAVGFEGRTSFYYQDPDEEMDYGFTRLETPHEFATFRDSLWPNRWRETVTIYADDDSPTKEVKYNS